MFKITQSNMWRRHEIKVSRRSITLVHRNWWRRLTNSCCVTCSICLRHVDPLPLRVVKSVHGLDKYNIVNIIIYTYAWIIMISFQTVYRKSCLCSANLCADIFLKTKAAGTCNRENTVRIVAEFHRISCTFAGEQKMEKKIIYFVCNF
jgi:hypothetical protein